MKRKIIALIAVALVALLALASCKVKPNDGQNQGGDEGNSAVPGLIFSPTADISVVKSEAASKLDIDEIWTALYRAIGLDNSTPGRIHDGVMKTGHEIVVGDTTRPISAKAKAALDDGVKRIKRDWEDRGLDSTFLICFAIYSDGESVALVWNDESARPLAYDYFINNYLTNQILMLEDGYVRVEGMDRIEILREEEAVKRKAVYAKIAEEYGWDIANALETHLGMFDERYYYWMADLYNPGEYDENGNALGGGFYYSNSGRDNVGYNIDIESTAQALNWITGSSGLFANSAQAKETLPKSMLDEMAAFVLSCQSSSDGYFYHPQWGTNVQTSRVGRDLGNATTVLNYCGVVPYWNTPNAKAGFFGEPNGDDSVKNLTISEYRNIIATGVAPAGSLSGRLSASSVAAVSKVIPAAKKWNGSSWLATLDAWEEYLQKNEENIHTSSYSIGNNFSAQSAQIKSRDKLAIANGELPDDNKDGKADGGYIETLKKYFDSWQFDNGLWEECSLEDGTVYYNAINGLMKISSTYDSLDIEMNHPVEAFKCAVFMVTYFGNGETTGNSAEDWKDSKGKAPTNSVDVYNPWVAMGHILSIVGMNDTALQEELRQITKDNAIDMIKATTKKIAKFSKNDGSFGYSWSYSPPNSQGAPVAVPNTVEGDINGGNIAFTGTFNYIKSVLGITAELKPFDYSDGLLFAQRISELSPIVKNDGSMDSASSETGVRDFDEDKVDSGEASGVSTNFNAGKIVIKEDAENSENKYLAFHCVSSSVGGNTVTFPAKQEKASSGQVFEFRMKFDEIPADVTTGFQITMGSYMFTFGLYSNGQFRIGDASSTSTPNITQWFDTRFNAYEWHKIRVEFYVIDAETRETAAQIYVDDELRFISNNYVGKEKDSAPTLTFKEVKFFSLKATNCIINIDDVYAAQLTTPYVPKPIYRPDLVKDFDNVDAGSDNMPSGVTTTGGEVVPSPTVDKPNNNIFVLNANGETVSISSVVSYADANCYSLNTKLKIDSESVGAIAKLYLAGKDLSRTILGYRIEVYESEGKKYARLTEFDRDGNDGSSYSGLPVGEWFTLTVEFYPYFYESSESSIVYLNGKEIGRGSKYYFIGNISSEYTQFVLTMTANATVSLDDVSPDNIAKRFVLGNGTQTEDPDITLPLGIAAKDDTAIVDALKSATFANCYRMTTLIKIEAGAIGSIANLYIAGKDATYAIAAYRVEIYEEGGVKYARLTEFNKEGKNGKSISGIPVDEWVTLTIEFYPYFYESDACSIVYLGDKEIGRGNTHYYIGTLSAEYEKFIATMTADGAAIYFKDTVAHNTNKKFVDAEGNLLDDPDIVLPKSGESSKTAATEDHNGVFDFEEAELGTPKVPGLTTTVNTTEYGYWLDIMKDPTDAANQCISHIIVPTANKIGNYAIYTASKQSEPGSNCYVLEFDLLVGKSTAGQIQIGLGGNINNKDVKLFQTNFVIKGDGSGNGTVELCAKRDDSSSLGSVVDSGATPDEGVGLSTVIIPKVNVSGWMNVRFELYTDKSTVKIFYDDVYVGETNIVYNNQMKAALVSATVYSTYGTNCEIYFDNVVVEAFKRQYEAQNVSGSATSFGDGALIPKPEAPVDPEKPDTPVVPEEPSGPIYPEGFDGTYDFDDYQSGVFEGIYGLSGDFPAGGDAMVRDDSESAGDKVLWFQTNSGGNEYVKFDTYKVKDVKKYVFEWDMRINSAKSSNLVQLGFGGYMITISYNSQNKSYSIGDISSTNSSKNKEWHKEQKSLITNIALKEWHTFKVEYAIVGSRAMIKIYFDGNLCVVSDNHFNKDYTLVSSESGFDAMKFTSIKAAEFVVEFDNVKAYGSTEEMVPEKYTHEVHSFELYQTPHIVEGAVSDFDSVNNIRLDASSAIADYAVVNDPLSTETGDAVNKVLHIALKNSEQSYDSNVFSTHNPSEAKGVGVYELAFEMCFDAEPPTDDKSVFQFVVHSDTGYAMLFDLKYADSGKFSITQSRRDGTSGVSATLATELDLADGKWHNVRFVIEYNGTDSYVLLYVDGVGVSSKNTYFWDSVVTDGTPLESVTWRVCNNLSKEGVEVMDFYDLYVDNMYFVYAGEIK